MTLSDRISRSRMLAVFVAAAFFLAFCAAAQDAPSVPASPVAHSVADTFAEKCTSELLPTIPDMIRDDAGKEASPLLIQTMVDVSREGMCECFAGVIRSVPDDRITPALMDDFRPQFNACTAAAIKSRMAVICNEAQRMPKDDSAPACDCLATKVMDMDDATLGAGANDLFDLLNSTRNIPSSAGALGDAARACAARPSP